MRNLRKLSLLLVAVMIISSFSMGGFAETYTVKSGDVLWRIAQSYGTDYMTLAKFNNIADPNKIYIGDKIEIPVAGEGEGDTVKSTDKITILGTSDLHGRIYAYEYAVDEVDADAGLAKVSTIVKQERAIDPNLLLMDMGDTLQDNSADLFNDLPVHPMIQAMNDIGYDTWTIGNHEFNFERSFVDKNIAAFNGVALSANIYKEGTTERYVKGYEIFDVNGVRVAIVGMIPPHVPVWEASSPKNFEGLEFTDVEEETAKVIAELEGKYDVLVGAYHLGPDPDHDFIGIDLVAEKFPEFDVIFGGHAHSKYENEINGVKLIEPGAYGWAVSKAEIAVVKSSTGYDVVSVTTQNIETAKVAEDQAILDKYAFVHEQSIADANTIVGKVAADFVERVDYITGESKVTTMPTIQLEDSALIDLINEVQAFYTEAQISSAAAFKNDMNLLEGDFKKKNAADIYKYTNTLMGLNITGKNLKAYMEWSASYYNTYKPGDVTISFNENIRGYNYDMFSGVKYEIDISQKPGSRIKNLTLNGAPIVDTQTYKLAVNNYRFGTLMSLGLATADDVYYDSYIEFQDAGRIRELIAAYLASEKGGIATPSVDNNWKIVGADLNHELKAEIYQMIIDGKIEIPTSADGRTPNVKAVNVYDLIKEGLFPAYKPLTILHTNDMHGFFIEGAYDGMGAPKMATYYKMMKGMNDNLLIMDAGDALQGHNLVTLSKGEVGTRVLNALGYDVMTLGNHEFDYGSDQTLKLAGMLDFPMLAANVTKEDGSLFVDAYKVFEVDGLKVGVFGLATPETTYKSHPDNTIGLTFEDIYETGTDMVATLKAMNVDVIVGLVHLGDEGEYTSKSLAEAVDGIDLLIDGHSHSTYNNGVMVGNTLIVAAGEKTKNIGVVEFAFKGDSVVSMGASLFTKKESEVLVDDVAMTALIAEIKAANDIITEEVVATSPVILNGEKDFVRAGETNLGNLLTEALLDISGADVAFTNGGGIRASIDAGPVTKGDVLTVLPYGNTVRVIEVTGADLVAAMENGIDMYPESKGAFPHIAGMTLKFDSSKPAGERVVELKVAGVLVDLTKTYSLATNDFIVAGGDGYTMFIGKKVIGEYGAMDEVLIDFMNKAGFDKAVEDGRIEDVSETVGALVFLIAA